MKKSTIGVIVTAAIMVIVGIGLFVGGIVATGGIGAAKKELAEHGIFFEDGFRVEINKGIHDRAHEVREHSAEEAVSYDMDNKKTTIYDMGDVESLHLEVKEAEVEIGVSTDGKISIRTDGNYTFDVRKKVLYVEPKGMQKEHKMLIELPETQRSGEFLLKDVEIHAGASSIFIDQISSKEIDLEVGAGQINISKLVAEHAEFEVGAGEIVVEYGNVHECDTTVEAGNFEYTGMILKHGDVECNLGNAAYCLERDVEEYNYEIECGAGNIDIGNESYSGLGREKYIDNHTQESFEIECNVGNVSISSIN